MIQIAQPLTIEGPTSRQIGRKLAKLFATMRRLERPQSTPQPRFRNGMDALAQWEQKADAASDKFSPEYQKPAQTTMTPAQLDHLKLIDAHLAKLLDIAAKRTPGEWASTSASVRHGYKGRDLTAVCSVTYKDREDEANAAFIASCAGNAEAGWRGTRAAIYQGTWLMEMDQQGSLSLQDQGTTHEMLLDILAAFPLELVKPCPATL